MARPDFDPLSAAGAHALPPPSPEAPQPLGPRIAVPGHGDVPGYVYAPETALAVRVALATGRPLLVTGEPGVGKSTLAASVAAIGGWPLQAEVVTSRTQARDLMWRHDPVRRLADAALGPLKDDAAYVQPRALWWAFDPLGAARFAGRADPKKAPPMTVVLIDEIDKAEPDVPNDLLEALDRGRFEVTDLNPVREVQGRRERVLMVITSNRERELPNAFLRRCVALHLPPPDREWLERVGAERFGSRSRKLQRDVAARVVALRAALPDDGSRKPGTAEFLDAVAAAIALGVTLDSPRWAQVERTTLWKRDTPLPT